MIICGVLLLAGCVICVRILWARCVGWYVGWEESTWRRFNRNLALVSLITMVGVVFIRGWYIGWRVGGLGCVVLDTGFDNERLLILVMSGKSASS